MERKISRGFTLMEIMLVLMVIAVLATIVFVALDPVRRYRETQDARRSSDIQALVQAINQYMIDHAGKIPAGLTKEEKMIGIAKNGCAVPDTRCASLSDTSCVDMSSDLKSYFEVLPSDPVSGDVDHTGYTVAFNENGSVRVTSCFMSDESRAIVSR